ncbi:TetR/AcrR family transcriptional regulator [Microbacterium sp. W1N]|uniref:TetR/AcrR family transcriptional regulator n=1 Tax=Microbacterium festucae TaxID=2977531 RepID=UPI0021BFD2E7|nr:TetR/AcrR family transcriptional regulator [Microbacterium festucae]MCT9820727.1 TetR/AcrR family transcriptional regulator [Microbacterium festucae]
MTDQAEPELSRAVALAWGVAVNPQRGPKREMSVERIVDAAIEIADAEGLGAVSMAAVAARLGYTAMSLYRYVSAKDDLVLLMQEAGVGLPPAPPAEGGHWRQRIETLYAAQMGRYLQHPWLLDIPINGSPTTPNSAAWMDAGLAALSSTALSHAERLAVVLAVTGLARWCGVVYAGYARAAQATGLSDEALAQREDQLFRALIDVDAFPALRAAIDAGVFLDEGDPFAFGLARLLDGVVAHAEHRASGRPVEAPAAPEVSPLPVADKRVREAQKAVRAAERQLRDAQRDLRHASREALDRAERAGGRP